MVHAMVSEKELSKIKAGQTMYFAVGAGVTLTWQWRRGALVIDRLSHKVYNDLTAPSEGIGSPEADPPSA